MSSRNERLSKRFIEGIWKRFYSSRDTSWVRELARSPIDQNTIGGDLGVFVNRMLDSGFEEKEISHLFRTLQFYTAWDILYYLDDFESDDRGALDSDDSLEWHLAVTDSDHNLEEILDVSCERLTDYSPDLEWTSLLPSSED